MGSTIDYSKCPRCGGIYYTDFNYNTGETFEFCQKCGRQNDYYFKRDDNGKVILNENQKPIVILNKHTGYGIAHFAFKGSSVSELHSLPRNQKKAIKAFFKELEENENVDKEKCFLSVWDKDKKEIVSKYGKLPENFDDLEK